MIVIRSVLFNIAFYASLVVWLIVALPTFLMPYRAMVAVAKLVLDGKPITDGVDVPGLGKAAVDVAGKQIKVDKIMRINNETITGLIAGGL